MGCGFQGLGLSVLGDEVLVFRIQDVWFRVWHLESTISDLEQRVEG